MDLGEINGFWLSESMLHNFNCYIGLNWLGRK